MCIRAADAWQLQRGEEPRSDRSLFVCGTRHHVPLFMCGTLRKPLFLRVTALPYSWVQVRERNTFYFHEIPMPEPRTVHKLESAVIEALLPGNANGSERRIFRYI
jgi:hypothetical protein